ERLERDVRRELDHRERLAEASHAVMLAILLVGAVIELAFAVAASGVIRRHLAERRRANREIERSERTLRSFYDSGVTMMGIVEVLEDDIRLVSVNSATAQMHASEPDKLIGKRGSEVGIPADLLRLYMEKYEES